jgi:hypothetical protein
MTDTINTRRRAVYGVAGALAAIAVAIPAISAADGGHNDGHHSETIGTVESFDATTGTLTIAPDEGDSISGMVTDRTKIQCRNEDDDFGDDHGDDGPNHDVGDDHGDDGPGHDADDDNGGRHGGSGHGKRSHGGHRGNCSTDALVAGAMVEDADLDLGPTGLTFEEVELG